jgi:hypothetical protein
MKKRYIRPLTEAVKINQSVSLLAGSGVANGIDGSGEFDPVISGSDEPSRVRDYYEDWDE